MILLTLLHAGTIKDLFSQKRNTPKKPSHDPLGLPSIKSQCVHVTEESSEGYDFDDFVRCVNDAVISRHGWLCAEHGADQHVSRRQEYRDKDAEIVAGILAYERRALATAEREVIQVGAKIKIEYVSGLSCSRVPVVLTGDYRD